jgi:hypothetical protein
LKEFFVGEVISVLEFLKTGTVLKKKKLAGKELQNYQSRNKGNHRDKEVLHSSAWLSRSTPPCQPLRKIIRVNNVP